MKIEVINKSKHPLPKYETPLSAGVDLRANIDESITLKPLERALVLLPNPKRKSSMEFFTTQHSVLVARVVSSGVLKNMDYPTPTQKIIRNPES